MKRVHNDPGTSPKDNATGSSPPSHAPTRSKKRKPESHDVPFVEKAVKKVLTPAVFELQAQESELIDRYLQNEKRLRELVSQVNDPRSLKTTSLLRSAGCCIKVMSHLSQKINAASSSKQQSG